MYCQMCLFRNIVDSLSFMTHLWEVQVRATCLSCYIVNTPAKIEDIDPSHGKTLDRTFAREPPQMLKKVVSMFGENIED